MLSATRDMVFDDLQRFKVTPKIFPESGSTDLMKKFVIQGNGASLLVRVAVLNDLKNKRLRTFRILECARP